MKSDRNDATCYCKRLDSIRKQRISFFFAIVPANVATRRRAAGTIKKKKAGRIPARLSALQL